MWNTEQYFCRAHTPKTPEITDKVWAQVQAHFRLNAETSAATRKSTTAILAPIP